MSFPSNIILHKIFYKYIEQSLKYNEKLKISSIKLINYEHGKSSNFIVENEDNLHGPIILINLNYDWDTLYEGNLIFKNEEKFRFKLSVFKKFVSLSNIYWIR